MAEAADPIHPALAAGHSFLARVVCGIATTCLTLLALITANSSPGWVVMVWIVIHTTLTVKYRDALLRDYYVTGPVIRLLACVSWLVIMTLILSAVPGELKLAIYHFITSGLSSAIGTYIWYYQLDRPSYSEGYECVVARDIYVLQILTIASYSRWAWFSGPMIWILCRLLPSIGLFTCSAWFLLKAGGRPQMYTEAVLALIRQNVMRLFWWQDIGDVVWIELVRIQHNAIYKQIHKLGERKRELHIDLPVYEYRPLGPNHIRLLVIKPVKFSFGPVFEATLRHAKISELPAYEAISYRWGNDEKTDEIIIDYQSFHVTKSAIEVLLTRRRWLKPRTVWIDAICINQADPEEKTSQIQLMRQIYAQAYRVVAFPNYEPELRLVESLLNEEAIATQLSQDVDSFWNFRPLLANGNFTARWKAYRDLLFSDYFRRAWIVQELVAGREVQLYLHGFYVNWQTFMNALARFRDPFRMGQLELAGYQDESVTIGGSKTVQQVLNAIILIDNLREVPSLKLDIELFKIGSHRKLEHLLEYVFDTDATDARDYVFSIVGLATDVTEQHETLKPDYKKSTRQVLEDVTRFIFVEHDHPSLLLLSRAGIGHTNRERGVPSWVLNPSDKIMYGPLNHSAFFRTFQACSYHHFKVQSKMAAPGKLRLQGFRCDKIRAISELDLIDMDHQPGARHPALPLMRNKLSYIIDNMAFINKQLGMNPPDLYEQMYRVFVADHIEDKRVKKEHKQTFAELLLILLRSAESKDFMDMVRRSNAAEGHDIWAPVLPSTESNYDPNTMAYNGAFTSACIGRRIAVTTAGRCCLVPSMSQVGDQIFIPCGSMTPYVIRHDSEADTVQLVGEAYVHGIMYGEAVKEDSEAKWLTFR